MKTVYIKNLLPELPDEGNVMLSLENVDEVLSINSKYQYLYSKFQQQVDGTILELTEDEIKAVKHLLHKTTDKADYLFIAM